MRIDAMNHVSQIYQANGAKKYSNINNGQRPDSLEISQIGKDIQVTKAAVKAAPEVREDKVAQIKAAMENGTYNVSDEALAEKLLERFDLPF